MVEHIDGWLLLAYLVNFISPIVVGLFTKQSWSSGVKAVLLALVTAVTMVGAEALDSNADGSDFNLQVTAMNALIGFTIAVAGHFGLWRPSGVSSSAQASLIRD